MTNNWNLKSAFIGFNKDQASRWDSLAMFIPQKQTCVVDCKGACQTNNLPFWKYCNNRLGPGWCYSDGVNLWASKKTTIRWRVTATSCFCRSKAPHLVPAFGLNLYSTWHWGLQQVESGDVATVYAQKAQTAGDWHCRVKAEPPLRSL